MVLEDERFKLRSRTNYIVVHCTDTYADMDIGLKEIDLWHKNRKPPFFCCGYHYIIRRDGTLEKGRPVNVVGAHVSGYNSQSIGICLAGGKSANDKPINNFLGYQFATLDKLIRHLLSVYPGAKVVGHRDLDANKACPCFDVRHWLIGATGSDVSTNDKEVIQNLTGASRSEGVLKQIKIKVHDTEIMLQEIKNLIGEIITP